jgi:hypothetical protein
VPKHVKLYGFFYEINSGKLTEVVRDIPAPDRIVRQLVYRSKIGATKQGSGYRNSLNFFCPRRSIQKGQQRWPVQRLTDPNCASDNGHRRTSRVGPVGADFAKSGHHVALLAERDCVHNSAWHERKNPRNHECAGKDQNHRDLMCRYVVVASMSYANHQHDRRENRQDVDWAPSSPQSPAVTMNPIRGDADD